MILIKKIKLKSCQYDTYFNMTHILMKEKKIKIILK